MHDKVGFEETDTGNLIVIASIFDFGEGAAAEVHFGGLNLSQSWKPFLKIKDDVCFALMRCYSTGKVESMMNVKHELKE